MKPTTEQTEIMTKEQAKQYINDVRHLLGRVQDTSSFMDYAMRFCEDNNLHELFISCKFSPVILFAYARYIYEEKDIMWLEETVNLLREVR